MIFLIKKVGISYKQILVCLRYKDIISKSIKTLLDLNFLNSLKIIYLSYLMSLFYSFDYYFVHFCCYFQSLLHCYFCTALVLIYSENELNSDQQQLSSFEIFLSQMIRNYYYLPQHDSLDNQLHHNNSRNSPFQSLHKRKMIADMVINRRSFQSKEVYLCYFCVSFQKIITWFII